MHKQILAELAVWLMGVPDENPNGPAEAFTNLDIHSQGRARIAGGNEELWALINECLRQEGQPGIPAELCGEGRTVASTMRQARSRC